MQRQAVPLVRREASVIGRKYRAAKDSGEIIVAELWYRERVTADEIIIKERRSKR